MIVWLKPMEILIFCIPPAEAGGNSGGNSNSGGNK